MGGHIWLVLGMCVCMLGTSGCLGHRLTAAEVVRHAQAALDEAQACRSTLELDIDTDLLKDSVSLEIWERKPGMLKVQVLSAINPQLQGLAFTTDGKRSEFYSPHASQVLVGPVDRVRMPLVLDRLLAARKDWMRLADPEEATMVAKEREGGLVMYKVQIPLSAAGFARYAVDARHWWVRRIVYEDEYLGEGEILVREMACFPELADEEFVLDIPEGVPVTEVSMEDGHLLTMEEAQMAVPFPLRTPGDLPVETYFVAAYQLEENVALVYAGEWPFTLVQGPDIAQVPQERATPIPLQARQAMAFRDAERGEWVLVWQEDGLYYSVAGALEREDIVRIAESLEPAFASVESTRGLGSASDQGR